MVNTADAVNSIHKVSDKAETFGTRLKKGIATAAKWGAALVGAAVAVGTAMYKTANKVADVGDAIDKGSQKMGVTSKQYQTLALAAEHCGTSLGTMQKASNAAMKAGYDDIYSYLTELEKIPDASERMAKAQEELGTRTANEMAALINGTQSLEDYKNELESTGYMSEEAVQASAKFKDTLTTLKTTATNVGLSIGGQLLPVVTNIMQFIIDHAPQIKAVADEISGYIKEAISGLQAFWKQHGDTILAITKTAFAMIQTTVRTAMTVLKTAINAVMKLIEGDWKGFWNGIKSILKSVASWMQDLGGQIITALLNGMKSMFAPVINWVNEKVEWFKGKWNDVKNNVANIANAKSGGRADGSHASGLPYVPFDGYKAVLHKGEKVVNAREAASQSADINKLIESMNQNMYKAFSAALDNHTIEFNNRELGRLVRSYV